MTARERILELAERAAILRRDHHTRDDQRIDSLCRLVEELAELVALCAPENKEI